MSSHESTAQESAVTDGCADLEPRDARALTECMSVLPDVGRARGADGLYLVVSESGSEYLVDAYEGSCECPDARHRDARCKHQRRVSFANGAMLIPAWIDVNAVDPDLGQHTAGVPQVAVTDGGMAVTEEEASAEDERPGDCQCTDKLDEIPCWPCYREGWESPKTE